MGVPKTGLAERLRRTDSVRIRLMGSGSPGKFAAEYTEDADEAAKCSNQFFVRFRRSEPNDMEKKVPTPKAEPTTVQKRTGAVSRRISRMAF